MERARQLISQWVQRAAVLGYLQEIPGADGFDGSLMRRDGADMTIPASIVAAELELSSLVMTASD
jgi:hypothetical protein